MYYGGGKFLKVIFLKSYLRAGNRYKKGLIENIALSFFSLRKTMQLICQGYIRKCTFTL
jgi:hypothetical protein